MFLPSLFTAVCPVILASNSPRRQQFLQELGVVFTAMPALCSEPLPEQGEAPEAYACRTAQAKAMDVARRHAAMPGAIAQGAGAQALRPLIIAADTIVVVRADPPDGAVAGNDMILGKPHDEEDALRMLRLLAGRWHEVISAVSLLLPEGEATSFVGCTSVRFQNWPDNVLEAYVRTQEPLDKAGAYAVQGQGAFLVAEIAGSWSTVVGLPMTELVTVLLQKGLLIASHECLFANSLANAPWSLNKK